MATSSYRIKPLLSSNLAEGVEIVGRFSLTTNGAVGTVRPSAGSNPGTGEGLLYTVTQLPAAYGSSAANCYQVTLTETYFKVVGAVANYSPAFSLTLGSVALYDAQASTFDTTTNSFVIYVTTKGTVGGAATAPVRTESLASGSIKFHLYAIPTVSPATT